MLKIREIFPSIQGEGPFSGQAAIFVRLAGCNLSCFFCDEHHEDPYQNLSYSEVLGRVEKFSRRYAAPIKLVVITGGEPFLQDFAPLTKALWDRGFRVQVETNGTIYQRDYPYSITNLVCSPKRQAPIAPELKVLVGAWKFLVQARDSNPAEGLNPRLVYLQPMDEGDPRKNQENMDRAVALCMDQGYRLSLQLHKIAGIQ